ncbi:MAG: transposase [Candidatus Wallbacteria bacterium]|nr:transposase [Candidatus Wallbacteria bacterium]
MPRISRVVVPGVPHHVVQRGNRRQRVFFQEADRRLYVELLGATSRAHGLEIWAYCLMDNHVHLIAVPREESSLSLAIGDAHRCYTRHVHRREGWRGYLWQGRFLSYPLSERHLLAAVRYVENNPVRAGMVAKAEDHVWSSAASHVRGTADPLLSAHYLSKEITDWAGYLEGDDGTMRNLHRRHSTSGRPLGEPDFVLELEKLTGRELLPKRTVTATHHARPRKRRQKKEA